MTCGQSLAEENTMIKQTGLSKKEEEKLLLAYKILDEFSGHEFPVIRFNCRKAKNELWQALFELDLFGAEDKVAR